MTHVWLAVQCSAVVVLYLRPLSGLRPWPDEAMGPDEAEAWARAVVWGCVVYWYVNASLSVELSGHAWRSLDRSLLGISAHTSSCSLRRTAPCILYNDQPLQLHSHVPASVSIVCIYNNTDRRVFVILRQTALSSSRAVVSAETCNTFSLSHRHRRH